MTDSNCKRTTLPGRDDVLCKHQYQNMDDLYDEFHRLIINSDEFSDRVYATLARDTLGPLFALLEESETVSSKREYVYGIAKFVAYLLSSVAENTAKDGKKRSVTNHLMNLIQQLVDHIPYNDEPPFAVKTESQTKEPAHG